MGWERFRFKGGKIYARVDGSGELVVDSGLVEIRYRPTDPKSYRAAASKLRPLDSGEPVATGPPKASLTRRDRRLRADAPATDLPVGAVAAYTDGACSGNPGPAGWGVVLRFGAHVRELSGYLGPAQTHNIAEIWAIKEALLAVTDHSRAIYVYTDSTYAMGVLSEGWKAQANQDLVAEILEIANGFSDLQFVKVSGHTAVPGNERADALARKAIPENP